MTTPQNIYKQLLKSIKLFNHKNYEEYFNKKVTDDYNSLDLRNPEKIKEYISTNSKLNDELNRITVVYGIYKNVD